MTQVHDIRGGLPDGWSVYDYMMVHVSHGDVCLFDSGIAIMDVAWPVMVFGDMSKDAPAHVLDDSVTWLDKDSFMRTERQFAALIEGLLVAWAIACG